MIPETQNSFGNLVRRARHEAGKTLGDVARCLDVSVSFVADVEHGRRSPFKREQIFACANLLGIDPLTLLKAAADQRGGLTVAPLDASRMDIVAGLARSIDDLTPEQLARIREALEDPQ